MTEELKLDLMKKFKELNVAEYTSKYGDYYGLMFAGAEIAIKELQEKKIKPEGCIIDKDEFGKDFIAHCDCADCINRSKALLELRKSYLEKINKIVVLEKQIEEMKRCEICAKSRDWRNRSLCIECEKSKSHINFELRR